MKERPILMNAAMVRAVLAGTKTQTRRLVKLPEGVELDGLGAGPVVVASKSNEPTGTRTVRCPFGGPGDRLWVRETFRPSASGKGYHYPASLSDYDRAEKGPWTPSIHMPRAASRIDLEVTGVRVERLQDLAEEDARAEGVEPDGGGWRNYLDAASPFITPQASFATLWTSINGAGSWEASPWVWVVSFRQVEAMRGRGL